MLEKKSRNFDIDCLRVIGLLCIILAHIPRVPEPIMALRRFDVPFMVVISGYLFSKSKIQNTNINILNYLYSRIQRLVYPTWIFLTIFFVGSFFVSKLLGIDFIKINQIIRSYLLIDGIGYVWIIRIYLIVGFFGPLLVKRLKLKMNSIILYYIIYEVSLIIFDLIKFRNNILEVLIFTPLPYILFFIYGFKFSSFENMRKFNFYNLIFAGFTLILGTTIYFLNKDEFLKLYLKYPPRLFYIFYGVFVSNFLMFNRSAFLEIRNTYLIRVISFIGKSTLWIYLWHIVVVYGILILEKKVIIDYKILFLVTVTLSTVITFIQNKISDYLVMVFPNKKKMIEILLKG